MENRLLNKNRMLGTVLAALTQNLILVNTIPNLVIGVALLLEILTESNGLGALNSVLTPGKRTSKQHKKNIMSKIGALIAAQLKALGHATENDVLFAQGKHTHSSLLHETDEHAEEVNRGIWTLAGANSGALLGYLITPVIIDSYDLAIKAFHDEQNSPISAQDLKRANVLQQNVLAKRATDLLENQIDGMMLHFEDSDPIFFEFYHNSRVTLDLGVHHGGVKGRIFKIVNGVEVGLYGAIVRIGDLFAVTDIGGVYFLPITVGGAYNMTVEHSQFVGQSRNEVVVVKGKATRVDFTLLPVAPVLASASVQVSNSSTGMGQPNVTALVLQSGESYQFNNSIHIDNATVGNYLVRFTSPGMKMKEVNVTILAGQDNAINVVMDVQMPPI